MSTKHKAHKETLDRGYASEWNDNHVVDYETRLSQEGLFLGVPIASEWDTAQTVGGAVPRWTFVVDHAFVVLNTGGVTGQISSMRHELGGVVTDITHPNDLPIMTMAVELVAFHNVGNVVEFGFHLSATAPFTANASGAYFRVFNNMLYAVTGTGLAETVALIGAYSQYAHYRIEFESAAVNFYVDDMENPAAVNTTTLPTGNLTMKFSVISANNVDSTIRVDANALSRLRKQ